MDDFKWYQDDSICHNCHNHCSLFDPGCDVGKRTVERRRKKDMESIEKASHSSDSACS